MTSAVSTRTPNTRRSRRPRIAHVWVAVLGACRAARTSTRWYIVSRYTAAKMTATAASPASSAGWPNMGARKTRVPPVLARGEGAGEHQELAHEAAQTRASPAEANTKTRKHAPKHWQSASTTRPKSPRRPRVAAGRREFPPPRTIHRLKFRGPASGRCRLGFPFAKAPESPAPRSRGAKPKNRRPASSRRPAPRP